MQPFQYDSRGPAAKDISITHAAAAPSNLDAAITMRSAQTGLQKTELRARASEIAAPKPYLDSKAKKKICERKITSAKIGKISWQITIAALMQPFQYDSRCPAAKDKSITHGAAPKHHLDATVPRRSGIIALHA